MFILLKIVFFDHLMASSRLGPSCRSKCAWLNFHLCVHRGQTQNRFRCWRAFTKHQKWQRSDKGSRVFIFYLCPRGLPEMINNLHQKCTGHTLEKHEGHMAKHTKLQISQCKVSCRGGLQNEDSRRYSTVNKNTSSSQIVVMGVNAKLGVLWKTLAKQHKQQQQ